MKRTWANIFLLISLSEAALSIMNFTSLKIAIYHSSIKDNYCSSNRVTNVWLQSLEWEITWHVSLNVSLFSISCSLSGHLLLAQEYILNCKIQWVELKKQSNLYQTSPYDNISESCNVCILCSLSIYIYKFHVLYLEVETKSAFSSSGSRSTMKICSPLSIENGAVKRNRTGIGSVVSIECGSGFSLAGSKSRKCLRNGQWSGSQSECLSKSFV